MSTWTTNGTTEPAGDAFGDTQTDDALSLVYTNPRRPNERVTATFGVVLNRANRYTAEIMTEHQVHKDGDWDNTPGATPVYDNEAFLQDHTTIDRARRDRDDTIRNWARQSFTDPELHVHPR